MESLNKKKTVKHLRRGLSIYKTGRSPFWHARKDGNAREGQTLGQEGDRHALVVQRLDDALQIAKVTRETVDAEHDHLVTFPHERDHLLQRGTMREDGHPDFTNPLPMFADEGLAVAGASIPLPNWEDVIEGPSVNFTTSQDVAGIQIADFAAFTISRTQWTVVQRQLGTPVSRSDEEFLSYGSGLNIVNLPKIAEAKNNLSKDSLEFVLERDRLAKGLPRKPTK